MKDLIVIESAGWRTFKSATSHPKKGADMAKAQLSQEDRDSKVFEALTAAGVHPWVTALAEAEQQRQRAIWEGSSLPPAQKTEREKFVEKREAEQQQAQAKQEAQQQEALFTAVFEACGGQGETRNETLDDAVFAALQ